MIKNFKLGDWVEVVYDYISNDCEKVSIDSVGVIIETETGYYGRNEDEPRFGVRCYKDDGSVVNVLVPWSCLEYMMPEKPFRLMKKFKPNGNVSGERDRSTGVDPAPSGTISDDKIKLTKKEDCGWGKFHKRGSTSKTMPRILTNDDDVLVTLRDGQKMIGIAGIFDWVNDGCNDYNIVGWQVKIH